jgi:hypothetical protein
VSELDDGDALRPEKKKQGNDPEPNGNAPVGGDGGNNVEIEDGDYEEQHKIAAPESTDQVRLYGGLGGRRQRFSGNAPLRLGGQPRAAVPQGCAFSIVLAACGRVRASAPL